MIITSSMLSSPPHYSRRCQHSFLAVAAAAADTWAVAHTRRHILAEGTRHTAAAEGIHRTAAAAAGDSHHIAVVGHSLADLISLSAC